MRLAALLLAACAVAPAGPKPTAGDYPARAHLEKADLGAEFLVHSFSGGTRMFAADDYLVVEVAVYPARGEALVVTASEFTLRLNGKKQALYAQAPGMVAASLKYPDWERRGQVEATAGIGNAGVILGRPVPVERFPGDPTARRLPAPPRAPEPENRAGMEKPPEPSAAEVAVSAALPEVETEKPVAGYLYFPYKGRLKNVRTVDLLYAGPAGKAEIRLR